MNRQYNIHEGVFKLQAGFKSTTAIIICPYLPEKIQVQNAHMLKILDGSEVYWSEIRRFIVNRKNSSKQETIIQATILGVKYSNYIYQGTNILCSIAKEQIISGAPVSLYARPISDKLPIISIVNHTFNQSYSSSLNNFFDQDYYHWVQIIRWNPEDQYPQGIITQRFKKTKQAQSEAEAVLYSMEINQRQYTEEDAQFKYRYNLEYNLPYKGHVKFQETIFSIDPKDCDDMQDALSVKTLDNKDGIYEVGVHISDVSSFLHLTDHKILCQRGCTVYLPHKKIGLFPKQITEICCFEQKKQRLALSTFLIINEKGQILQTRFQKTIVRNAAALTYEQAQQLLDQQICDDKKLMTTHNLSNIQASSIMSSLSILNKIAMNRRRIRKNDEILDRNQVTFELDQNKMPVQIGIRKRFQTQRLVEEFMIAVNGQVAKKLVNDYGQNSLVISHPRPTQYSINNFNSYLSDYGIKFNSQNILSLQREIKRLFQQGGIKDQVKQVLLMRALQMQQLATYTKYSNSQKGHYGLNMQYYTHFTSPLRRYADVLVHQQLKNCVFSEKESPKNISIASQLQILNKIRIKSKKLKHRIVQCFLNLLIHEKKQVIEAKALIMSFGKKTATLYIPLYNLVKQVAWKASVQIHKRDSVYVSCIGQNHACWKTIHKNDSIDIDITAGVHQEVNVAMFMKINGQKIAI